ncbi:MAG: hypothetical protein KKA84_16505 [Bacteroidetes bacterium]|nr:hypothetical protein [Bacteroidota bacterium]
MPILKSRHINFEFTPKRFIDNEFIEFEVNFLIGGQPVLNSKMTTDNEDASLKPGSITIQEDNHCGLIGVLNQVLKTNKPEVWWDIDVPLIIEVHPNAEFPLLFSYEKYSDGKNKGGFPKVEKKGDNDPMTLVIQVNPNHLIQLGETLNEGFSFIITVTRRRLKAFTEKLKSEIEYVKNKCSYVWKDDIDGESVLVPENINDLKLVTFKVES